MSGFESGIEVEVKEEPPLPEITLWVLDPTKKLKKLTPAQLKEYKNTYACHMVCIGYTGTYANEKYQSIRELIYATFASSIEYQVPKDPDGLQVWTSGRNTWLDDHNAKKTADIQNNKNHEIKPIEDLRKCIHKGMIEHIEDFSKTSDGETALWADIADYVRRHHDDQDINIKEHEIKGMKNPALIPFLKKRLHKAQQKKIKEHIKRETCDYACLMQLAAKRKQEKQQPSILIYKDKLFSFMLAFNEHAAAYGYTKDSLPYIKYGIKPKEQQQQEKRRKQSISEHHTEESPPIAPQSSIRITFVNRLADNIARQPKVTEDQADSIIMLLKKLEDSDAVAATDKPVPMEHRKSTLSISLPNTSSAFSISKTPSSSPKSMSISSESKSGSRASSKQASPNTSEPPPADAIPNVPQLPAVPENDGEDEAEDSLSPDAHHDSSFSSQTVGSFSSSHPTGSSADSSSVSSFNSSNAKSLPIPKYTEPFPILLHGRKLESPTNQTVSLMSDDKILPVVGIGKPPEPTL